MEKENLKKYEEVKYFLGGYYHQDTWEEHSTHQEICEDFIKNEKKELSEILLSELKELAQEDIEFIVDLIKKKDPHGLNLRTKEETKEWLQNCIKHFQSKL